MDKVRWGVLGCADIAENRFLPALADDVENGVLQAVASRGGARFERVVEKFKPKKTYLHYQELLADPDVDAVYLPLPNAFHKEWAVKAANAKKHVLCEKPIACSLSELEEMKKACEENNVLLMEGLALLHSPLLPAIKEIIASGEIGKVKLINSHFHFPLDNPDSIVLNSELRGGSIFDVGCYNTIAIRHLSGKEPIEVKAFGEITESGVDASCYALYDMGDGITGISQCAVNTAFRRGFSVLGEKGYIQFNRTPNAWGKLEIEVVTEAGKRIEILETKSTYALEVEQFGRCILTGEKPLVTLEESEDNLKAILMMHKELGLYQ